MHITGRSPLYTCATYLVEGRNGVHVTVKDKTSLKNSQGKDRITVTLDAEESRSYYGGKSSIYQVFVDHLPIIPNYSCNPNHLPPLRFQNSTQLTFRSEIRDDGRRYIRIKDKEIKDNVKYRTIMYIDLQKKDGEETRFRYCRYLQRTIPEHEITTRLQSFKDDLLSKMAKIDATVYNRHGICIVGWLKDNQPALFWSKPTDTDDRWHCYSPSQKADFIKKAMFQIHYEDRAEEDSSEEHRSIKDKKDVIISVCVAEEQLEVLCTQPGKYRISGEKATQLTLEGG